MVATKSSLRKDLQNLGVGPGDVLMVHSSLRALGPVRGGAIVIVEALQETIGPNGTLFAYVDFEPYYEDDDTEEIPVFDKRIAPAARDHGILHEVIRTWPGALRSDHPDAGVVAIGPQAEWLVNPHPLQYGYGTGTPFARLVEAGGKVLMLGAPLDTLTILHHAEHLAQIPNKRLKHYRRLMPGQGWVEIEEFNTEIPVHEKLAEDYFSQIAEAALRAGLGREGKVAQGRSALFPAPELVRFAVEWIEREAG
ncbi:MAG: aminoglycoside 3-N-acetyltransferase [Bryobacter sp.]